MFWFRRLMMLCVAASGSVVFASYAVHAEFERSLLAETAAAFELARHWVTSEPRTLVVNGVRIVLTTGKSEQPVPVLLDHLQSVCRRSSGGLDALARSVVARRVAQVPSLVDGVLRLEEEGQGLVACLALGEKPLSAPEWLARVERFAEAGDLNELGGLRVVRVVAHGTGSFFVAAHSSGSVPLARMFPERGDAPGADLPGVPRPPHARRLFSAYQDGAPTAANFYGSEQQVDVAFDTYLRALEQLGWKVTQPDALRSERERHAALLYRQGESLTVTGQARPDGSLLGAFAMHGGPGQVAVR